MYIIINIIKLTEFESVFMYELDFSILHFTKQRALLTRVTWTYLLVTMKVQNFTTTI